MSTIGPIGSSLGSSHAQVLKRAQEALETQKQPSEGFGNRITNAIDQVAAAQNKTADLVKATDIVVSRAGKFNKKTRALVKALKPCVLHRF